MAEKPNNDLKLQPVIKAFRENLLADPDRPGFHFCDPEGYGVPGDPNGCFYANGRYHLMYLYRHEEKGFCWGHVSSIDLLHWRHHPDCICAGEHGKGCYSGGAFLDEDGKCYISFWDFLPGEGNFGCIRIAVSDGEPYEQWHELPAPAVICNVAGGVATVTGRDGREHLVGAADPSNIWKDGGRYYMQTGNLTVLNKYSRGENPPKDLRGDWSDLFSSDDLHTWTYEGRFYDRNQCLDTEDSEDCMCPSFLPLPAQREGGAPSGKHLELFISHNKGCQYYVGTYDSDAKRFQPEVHGRMTVVDSSYFAPEALVGGDGRQIMWVWLRDNLPDDGANGWSGVFSMARELWYDGSDGTLRMAPAKEYERLRINPQSFSVDLTAADAVPLPLINGLSCELRLEGISPADWEAFELRLRVSDDAGEYVRVYLEGDSLVMDSTNGSPRGWAVVERMPVRLPADETLTLTVYVDGPVIEIYANDRAAIGRRVYTGEKSAGIILLRRGTGGNFTARAWEIAPCNPY